MSIQNNKCPELEQALRKIPGIGMPNNGVSYMSCMGHEGGKSVNVWITPRDQRVLMVIARQLDNRYGNLPWKFYVSPNDMREGYIGYHLQSDNFGDEAIEDSKILAKYINDFMNDTLVHSYFGLDNVFREQTN